MKKILVLGLACGLFQCCFSQQTEDGKNNNYGDLKGGFRQENVFIGGSFIADFGGGQLTLGASPEIGYSFAQWFDAGVSVNLIYTSVAANTYYNPSDTKLRQFNYGGGPFIRIYPVNFLFVQGQFEENWTKIKVKDGIYTYRQTVHAPSLIAGIGYGQRIVGQANSFFMIGLDLLKNAYSPYVSENESGQLTAQPIVRVGINWYLRPPKEAGRESRYQSARIL